MNPTVITALVVTLVVYLVVALRRAPKVRTLDQLLPLTSRAPHIGRADEFATNTIATSISLATVLLAIFELFPFLKLWLLWTAITTAAGLFVVRSLSNRIWQKMQVGVLRPTLHEFLGREYMSRRITTVAAIFTCLGFMGALALELSVGARFLSSVVAEHHLPWLIGLGVVVFICTGIGGYRSMVTTERMQMYTIYALLAGTAVYLSAHIAANGTAVPLGELPLFPVDGGLVPFLLGIFFINVPSFVSDMSIWQRIAATKSPEILRRGLNASWAGSATTWSMIVFLALGTCLVLVPAEGKNPLFSLLGFIESGAHWWKYPLLVVIVVGLLGAMISTAATQLMAACHAFYEDIYAHGVMDPGQRVEDQREVKRIRWFMLLFTIVAVAVVEILTARGFTIADLVFAVFGAQLSLFPPVLLALLNTKRRLHALSGGAIIAVTAGFIAGWLAAMIGKARGNSDLVFLAPVASMVVSAACLGMAILMKRNELRTSA